MLSSRLPEKPVSANLIFQEMCYNSLRKIRFVFYKFSFKP